MSVLITYFLGEKIVSKKIHLHLLQQPLFYNTGEQHQKMKAQISNLTPIRGIAAVMVAIYHFNEIAATFVNAKATQFMHGAYLMVDLFFVLSGFIIMYVYGEQFSNAIKASDVRQFIKARFARVYPLHFIILLLAAMPLFFAGEITPMNNWKTFFLNVFMLHSMYLHNFFSFNVPSWSISAEWWCYVLFPLIALFYAKNKRVNSVILLAFALVLYVAILHWLPRVNFFAPTAPQPVDLNVTYDYGFLRGLAGFLVGNFCFYVYEKRYLVTFFASPYALLFATLLTIFLMHITSYDLLKVVAFALIVISAASMRSARFNPLNTKLLQYIGDISYSIYMVHSLVLFLFISPIARAMGLDLHPPMAVAIPFGQGVILCLLYLLIVVALSSVTYFLIEKRMRNWINRLGTKSNPPHKTMAASR
jgi:peptidoglycan/LPS O-acetylase OafA/YrhL